ncbi:hypothetical protein E3J84_00295 [Candidatus Aerophobetes bacterium]|uniref:Uncharacterized protein n=1 Tax=Aerophobetes bacterium TaxID=2030807 RepID=A0A523S5C5_UNCAE|nr:MAG: hypothetical protein E3J84_00295 [Candidatus Aerophobetes bacterium]
MANNLTSYGQFPEYWNPDRLKPLFDFMIIAGTIGIVVGVAFDDRRITGASTASAGAGIAGRFILSRFGY